jgi:hypothetical protein
LFDNHVCIHNAANRLGIKQADFRENVREDPNRMAYVRHNEAIA